MIDPYKIDETTERLYQVDVLGNPLIGGEEELEPDEEVQALTDGQLKAIAREAEEEVTNLLRQFGLI